MVAGRSGLSGRPRPASLSYLAWSWSLDQDSRCRRCVLQGLRKPSAFAVRLATGQLVLLAMLLRASSSSWLHSHLFDMLGLLTDGSDPASRANACLGRTPLRVVASSGSRSSSQSSLTEWYGLNRRDNLGADYLRPTSIHQHTKLSLQQHSWPLLYIRPRLRLPWSGRIPFAPTSLRGWTRLANWSRNWFWLIEWVTCMSQIGRL